MAALDESAFSVLQPADFVDAARHFFTAGSNR